MLVIKEEEPDHAVEGRITIQAVEIVGLSLAADLLNHLKDCSDGGVWLINLDYVAAVLCKQMLAVGR